MKLFQLPNTTVVNRIIPKNAFDDYSTTKQKKLFSEQILRITWTNKLSLHTINLEGRDIPEIQIFNIELKIFEYIDQLLEVIEKAIPYTIIFVVQYQEQVYFLTSSKHPNPINEANAVIDCTFKSGWHLAREVSYELLLKQSLDYVHLDFCNQLTGSRKTSMSNLIVYRKRLESIQKEISQIKRRMKVSKQFNEKVELNLELMNKEKMLKKILSE